MKREPEFFGDQELDLVFIGKKLKESLRLEDVLTAAEVDYAVEVDEYVGGVLFRTRRAGAFFYVLPGDFDRAAAAMAAAGFTAVTDRPSDSSTGS